jgi:multidrug efflux pump subunit AcrB
VKHEGENLTIRIVRLFLESHLSIVLILLALVVGGVALLVTPREEEPQIVVPNADIFLSYPGHSAEEVEKLISTPIERYMYQIDGVEYVYSQSKPGQSIVTVRFYVGQDRERSLVKLYKWLQQNADKVPAGVTGYVVVPRETDDVPIVTFTLTSAMRDDYDLRRMAEEVRDRLQAVHDSGISFIVGGRPREVLVRPDPERMAGFHIAPLDLYRALGAADSNLQSGSYARNDQDIRVETGRFLANKSDVASLVVGVSGDRPVYLRDVADVSDGPGEVVDYERFSQGPAWTVNEHPGSAGSWIGGKKSPDQPLIFEQPAVTIAVAKQKGTNNVTVARALLAQMEQIKREVLPNDVQVAVTRNYGITANDKVNELVEGLMVGIVVVIALLTIGLGFADAMVVAVAVPCVFGFTLAFNYLFGFSINRVTLFALTVALGLLVDDPIVDVENIHRHFRMAGKATKQIVLEAVNEVRPPLIAATIAVMISFSPLFFVTEEMHDYLRPMAVNVPMSMLMSMVVSFTITPWLAYWVMRRRYAPGKTVGAVKSGPVEADVTTMWTYRIFRPLLGPLLERRRNSYLFLGAVVLAFIASLMLVGTRRVKPKQLPFDNKDELLLVLDMPSGTSLERTDAAARDFENYLRTVPEVTDFESYSGTASPFDFNGMSRRYFLRESPNKGDIRVNLIHKTDRTAGSHEIALRLRDDLTAIAQHDGVKLKIVELPAGPPVMSTVVAAVYGSPGDSYADLIHVSRTVKGRMRREPGIVDLDDTVEEDQQKYVFTVDKAKAALDGVDTDSINQTVRLALSGETAGAVAIPTERQPLPIVLWPERVERSSPMDLARIYVRGQKGNLVPISQLGSWRPVIEDKTIYHRNMKRVVYVTAEMAGRPPVETILDIRADQRTPEQLATAGHPVELTAAGYLDRNAQPRPLNKRTLFKKGGGILWALPDGYTVNWWDEGEMRLTIYIFRDLGVGFLGALLAIYILLSQQTGSFRLPIIIMMAIPLMVIGVMPGFWLLNHLGVHQVGGYPDPLFFSSPAMIGLIALSGIVTRNSIIIVDFVHIALARGRTLTQALIESCSIRLRPILLTSGAAMLGAWPITKDSVFAGLAWSLIFGLFASTLFSLLVIPVAYYLMYEKVPGHGLPENFHLREVGPGSAATGTEVEA